MKHILNNLSEEEKKLIRKQHKDKIKIDTSKFKKLVESKLGEVKTLSEASMGMTKNISKDLELGDTLIVKNKENQESNLQIVKLMPAFTEGFFAKDSNGKTIKYLVGSADNQLRTEQTLPGDFVYTVLKVKVGDKLLDVNSKGEFTF